MNKFWERNKNKYADGSFYRIGKARIIVGVTNRAIGNKSEPDAPLWCAEMKLPGIKSAKGRFATEDEAKADIERRVQVWFGWME